MTEDPLPDNMEATSPGNSSASPEDPLAPPIENPDESSGYYGPDDETITFKRTHFFSVMVVLAFVLGIGLGYIIWGKPNSGTTTASAAETTQNGTSTSGSETSGSGLAAQAEPTSIPRFDIPLDDDPRLGPDDAEIVIVEFSDFECPYCRSFHNEVFQKLLDAYPGQIQFVYRDFPLTSIHPNAFTASEAANCAQEQGAYWEYHDLLFGGQLGLGGNAYSGYASQLGLDLTQFEQCLADGKYTDEIQADYDYAARLGVRSTPTFFINGLPLIGAQPFDVFSQIIDKELAGELN